MAASSPRNRRAKAARAPDTQGHELAAFVLVLLQADRESEPENLIGKRCVLKGKGKDVRIEGADGSFSLRPLPKDSHVCGSKEDGTSFVDGVSGGELPAGPCGNESNACGTPASVGSKEKSRGGKSAKKQKKNSNVKKPKMCSPKSESPTKSSNSLDEFVSCLQTVALRERLSIVGTIVDVNVTNKNVRVLMNLDIFFSIGFWSEGCFWTRGPVPAFVLSHFRCDWEARKRHFLLLEEKILRSAVQGDFDPSPAWTSSISLCRVAGCNMHSMQTEEEMKERFNLPNLFRTLCPPDDSADDIGSPILPESKELETKSGMWSLDDTLLSLIFQRLSAQSLRNLCCVCKHMKHIVKYVVPCLKLDLYPHQQFALRWMLERESEPKPVAHPFNVPMSTANGFPYVIDKLSGELFIVGAEIKNRLAHENNDSFVPDFRGGFLCDEPGLGKTITAISLILKEKGKFAEPPSNASVVETFCHPDDPNRTGAYYEVCDNIQQMVSSLKQCSDVKCKRPCNIEASATPRSTSKYRRPVVMDSPSPVKSPDSVLPHSLVSTSTSPKGSRPKRCFNSISYLVPDTSWAKNQNDFETATPSSFDSEFQSPTSESNVVRTRLNSKSSKNSSESKLKTSIRKLLKKNRFPKNRRYLKFHDDDIQIRDHPKNPKVVTIQLFGKPIRDKLRISLASKRHSLFCKLESKDDAKCDTYQGMDFKLPGLFRQRHSLKKDSILAKNKNDLFSFKIFRSHSIDPFSNELRKSTGLLLKRNLKVTKSFYDYALLKLLTKYEAGSSVSSNPKWSIKTRNQSLRTEHDKNTGFKDEKPLKIGRITFLNSSVETPASFHGKNKRNWIPTSPGSSSKHKNLSSLERPLKYPSENLSERFLNSLEHSPEKPLKRVKSESNEAATNENGNVKRTSQHESSKSYGIHLSQPISYDDELRVPPFCKKRRTSLKPILSAPTFSSPSLSLPSEPDSISMKKKRKLYDGILEERNVKGGASREACEAKTINTPTKREHDLISNSSWLESSKCKKWRKVSIIESNRYETSDWYCYMNLDSFHNNCNHRQETDGKDSYVQKLPGFIFNSQRETEYLPENVQFFEKILMRHKNEFTKSCDVINALLWFLQLSMEDCMCLSNGKGLVVPPHLSSSTFFPVLLTSFGLLKNLNPKYRQGRDTWHYPPNLQSGLTFDFRALQLATVSSFQSPEFEFIDRTFLSRATLVIVPPHLIFHWLGQIQNHSSFNSLRVHVMDGSEDKSLPAYRLASDYDIVITTFNRLSIEWSNRSKGINGEKCSSILMKIHWFRVILDEGHTLGSSLNFTNKLEMAVALKTSRRWLLTGTPTPNTPSSQLAHLQPLLRFLHENVFGDHHRLFESAIIKPFESCEEEGFARLHTLLKRCMITTTKSMIKSIPPCSRTVKLLEFTPKHAESYNELVETVMKNILMADWQDENHEESLLNPKHNDKARTALKNVRLSCNVAGNISMGEWKHEIMETMSILSKQGLLDSSQGYQFVQIALKYGVDCQRCKHKVRLPWVTPHCHHLICTSCCAENKEECVICGRKYKMQDLKPRKENKNPQWMVPQELIELQPSYAQETWNSAWSQTSSSKIEYLIQKIRKIWNGETDRDDLNHFMNGTKTSSAMASTSEKKKKKIIIFSQFVEHIHLIEYHLTLENIAVAPMYSPMKNDEKASSLLKFEQDPETNILVMDATGALGLDLSFASRVFIMEPIWNRSVEEQVISRAWRMGAKEPIVVETLAMKGTIEQQMLQFLEQSGDKQKAKDFNEQKLILKNLSFVWPNVHV